MKRENQGPSKTIFDLSNRPIHITLLPVTVSGANDVRALAGDLAEAGVEARVARARAVPPGAYDPARGQCEADAILSLAKAETAERVLAVTDVDLYARGLNFVFGIAETPGRAAVVSLCRLRLGADAARFRKRALKEALHELGHTLGLEHCPDPRCVMYFSNRLADTDRKEAAFCRLCQERLDRRLR